MKAYSSEKKQTWDILGLYGLKKLLHKKVWGTRIKSPRKHSNLLT